MDPIQLRGLQSLKDVEIAPRSLETRSERPDTSFADLLSRAVDSVDDAMKISDQKVEDFISGKSENVHDVMISMQRAQLSFQMMVEMRNKAIEAYHELSRMQI
jgi:flagellar hook-basal body complex protein FliE